MMNYSLDLEESETFVLNYTVKDNKITVNLANDENYDVLYTPKTEKMLLKKMKTQVLQSYKFMNKQEEELLKIHKKVLYDIVIIALAIGLGLLLNISSPMIDIDIFNLPFVVSLVAGSFVLFSDISTMEDIKTKIEDVKKSMLFVINEERINNSIKANQKILSNTTSATKELVQSGSVDQSAMTINSVDKIEYEELIQILENIDNEEQFDFACSDTSGEKTLVLNKNLK